MALTVEQQKFIQLIDSKATCILQQGGGKEELLMSLTDKKMSKIWEILHSAARDELNQYCEKYDGFYQYMKLLEELAQGCASGLFNELLP